MQAGLELINALKTGQKSDSQAYPYAVSSVTAGTNLPNDRK